jgi:hypothetical protein
LIIAVKVHRLGSFNIFFLNGSNSSIMHDAGVTVIMIRMWKINIGVDGSKAKRNWNSGRININIIVICVRDMIVCSNTINIILFCDIYALIWVLRDLHIISEIDSENECGKIMMFVFLYIIFFIQVRRILFFFSILHLCKIVTYFYTIYSSQLNNYITCMQNS